MVLKHTGFFLKGRKDSDWLVSLKKKKVSIYPVFLLVLSNLWKSWVRPLSAFRFFKHLRKIESCFPLSHKWLHLCFSWMEEKRVRMLSSVRKHYLLCQVLSPSFVPGKIRIVLLLYTGPFFFFVLLEVRCWWFYHCVFEKSVGILLLSESKPDLFLDLIQRKLVAIKWNFLNKKRDLSALVQWNNAKSINLAPRICGAFK